MTPQKEQQLREDWQDYAVRHVNAMKNNIIPIHIENDVAGVADYWLARIHEQEEELVKKIKHKSQFFEYSIPNPDEGKNKAIETTIKETIEQVLNIINPKHE